MKKSISLFLLFLLCLSFLSGCSANKADVSVFSEFLDTEKFVRGESQKTFIEQMEKYKYNGTPITESRYARFYDGMYGGGFQVTAELYACQNDYHAENNNVTYLNELWSKVELKGLKLPYKIKVGDSLSKVLKKIGYKIDPYNDFIADNDSDTYMTLYSDDNVTLIFKDLTRSRSYDEHTYPYVIIYTEMSTWQYNDGRVRTTERTVTFSFSNNEGTKNDVLEMFKIRVEEHYPKKQ